MNVFLSDYYIRLRNWHELRTSLKDSDIQTICVEVDRFWQKCPMSNHYLHPADIEDWPDPWNLLNDNNYCEYARALGMLYTLMLLGVQDIDFVEIMYDNRDSVVVLVDNAKYVMNWCPESVLNTDLTEFKITRRIDIGVLAKKIGKI